MEPAPFIRAGIGLGWFAVPEVYYDNVGRGNAFFFDAKGVWPLGWARPTFDLRVGLAQMTYEYFYKVVPYTNTSTRRFAAAAPGVEMVLSDHLTACADVGYAVYDQAESMDRAVGCGVFRVGFALRP